MKKLEIVAIVAAALALVLVVEYLRRQAWERGLIAGRLGRGPRLRSAG